MVRILVGGLILSFLIFFGFNLFSETKGSSYRSIEVSKRNDTIQYSFVDNMQLFSEGWNDLAQPNFWRKLMVMGNDSALINIGSTRQVINKVAVADWQKLTDERKDSIRDSIRVCYNLSSEEHVYMTSGKKHFYDFNKVIPGIGRGIKVFEENGVDPFYAQSILLIESPNKMQKSPVGAYGSFQLMRKVALRMGLTINRYVDERKDFDKSAWAAAKLLRTICIPEVNKMLEDREIEFEPTDTWYRLLVLHVYHAGAWNVKGAIDKIDPKEGGMQLITALWQTEVGNFRNASQNYSQLALASLFELDAIIQNNYDFVYTCP